MPVCIIDGKNVEFKPGQNLVDVAKAGGIDIPVFCYHPGLSVVAQCRMCAVEIEKMPKLQTACSTEAKEGMIVKTRSEKVLAARKSVMEFLLLNHPLDCPICDKAGECDLQDFSYEHGSAFMRHQEFRRTYVDLDMGPVIKKNMNRCIHCTRCIRFGDEVAKVREMVAIQRGNNVEITTLDGRALETDYAGNYADICPTGSLTTRDFRFHKRAWMLTRSPSICDGCSRGCNMEIHHDRGEIYRTIPRENMEVNRYWMCDEGRFAFRDIQREDRLVQPVTSTSPDVSWSDAISEAKNFLKGKKISVWIGTDLTTEEMKAIKAFAESELKGAAIYHFGTDGVKKTADDGAADPLLKRKSKTANLNGAESLGINPGTENADGEAVIVFRAGRASMPNFKGKTAVGIGVFFETEKNGFKVILPGPNFAEKDGSYMNFQGMTQNFKRSMAPPQGCKPVSEILMAWLNTK